MLEHDKLTAAFAELRAQGCTLDSEDWTEADTRSKFIDAVFKDCLGWSEADIHRELAKDKERLDYRLSTTIAAVVVEAKRASIEFNVVKHKAFKRIKLRTLITATPSLAKPIEQVATYCWRWSTPIAVLTNGRTYLIFIGNRTDNVPWLEGDAIVVPDLFAPDVDFGLFHGLLSKEAVTAGRPFAALLRDSPTIDLRSVVSTYAAPTAVVPANPVGLHLEPLLKQVFSDVTKEDSREVLEQCYVPPSDAAPLDQEFEALQLDRPPAYVRAPENVSSANTYRKFQEQVKEYLARTSWAQTLLVIGGVGVGKTFFLKRHFTLHSTEGNRDSLSLYIDFRKPELDPTRVPEMVWRKLREQLDSLDGTHVPDNPTVQYDFSSPDGLGQIFRSEVRKFEKLARDLKASNPPEYDKALVNRLLDLSDDDRGFVIGACRRLQERYHRRISVVLDNVDQCEPAYQKAVYLFSRTLEQDLQCLVIVALREEWYWYFGVRPDGPMSAYNDTIYHIPAPSLREVLAKRIDFSLDLVETQLGKATFTVGRFVVQAHHLAAYLRAVQRAFLKDESIALFHESMANRNIRKGLDVFLEFVRSGHTKVSEYLMAIAKKDDYVLQFHQVFKSVAFGSSAYYHSNRSVVPNLLYPLVAVAGGWTSYFSRVYLLNWLCSRSKLNSPVGTGFVPIAAARSLLSSIGLEDDTSTALLRDVVSAGLVEPDIRLLEAISDWTHLRITIKGFYCVRRLPAYVAYWEALMLDIPLNDTKILNRISGLYLEAHKPPLSQRLYCIRDFIQHLHELEGMEQLRVKSAGISGDCPPFMAYVAEVFQRDYERLEKQARLLVDED